MLWAIKSAFMIEYNLELVFDRHTSEQSVYCLATRHPVFVSVTATLRGRDQVLNTGVGFWQFSVTVKAAATLKEQQAIKQFR
jgi:hypothetical protein